MADVAINADGANIPAVNMAVQGSDPAAPGTGRCLLYIKAGGVYVRYNGGSASLISAAPTLTEGHLAIGDGSNAISAMAAGTEGYVVTADSNGLATWAEAPASGAGDFVLIDEFVATDNTVTSWTSGTIPATFRNLMIFIHGRTDLAGQAAEGVNLRFNGDTGANYTHFFSYSSLSAAAWTDYHSATATSIGLDTLTGATATANYANIIQVNVAGYRSPFFKTTEWRNMDVRDNSADNSNLMFGGGLWRNTDAITSCTIFTTSGGHFVTGTTISLYGLK